MLVVDALAFAVYAFTIYALALAISGLCFRQRSLVSNLFNLRAPRCCVHVYAHNLHSGWVHRQSVDKASIKYG